MRTVENTFRLSYPHRPLRSGQKLRDFGPTNLPDFFEAPSLRPARVPRGMRASQVVGGRKLVIRALEAVRSNHCVTLSFRCRWIPSHADWPREELLISAPLARNVALFAGLVFVHSAPRLYLSLSPELTCERGKGGTMEAFVGTDHCGGRGRSSSSSEMSVRFIRLRARSNLATQVSELFQPTD